MNSNNHPSAYGYQPRHNIGHQPDRYPPPEKTIHADTLDIERKKFIVALKENRIGRFLRILEQGGLKQSAIIVPGSGLKDFQTKLAEMVEASTAPKS